MLETNEYGVHVGLALWPIMSEALTIDQCLIGALRPTQTFGGCQGVYGMQWWVLHGVQLRYNTAWTWNGREKDAMELSVGRMTALIGTAWCQWMPEQL